MHIKELIDEHSTALTAVATRMGQRPWRKLLSASSLSRCERSPWMLVAG